MLMPCHSLVQTSQQQEERVDAFQVLLKILQGMEAEGEECEA